MPSIQHENELHALGYVLVAGVDEAGRGAWAGPVVAGAVILAKSRKVLATLQSAKVDDSKRLSPAARAACRLLIDQLALAVGSGVASSVEIDALGIVPATRLAMTRAIDSLVPRPNALIIDAVKLEACAYHQRVFNHADSISLSVAAASIVAKTTRDHLMTDLDDTLSGYDFARHKGYGTALHHAMLRAHGVSVQHRTSFAPVRQLLA